MGVRIPAPTTRKAARAYWRETRARWETWALDFAKKIEAIEDPVVRFAVAGLLKMTTSGEGSIAIAEDEEIEFDPEPVLFMAKNWIGDNLTNESMLQVAYAFGPIADRTPRQLGAFRPGQITCENVVYDLPRQRFVGVKMASGGIVRMEDLT